MSEEPDFDPSHYPALRLFSHITVKGTQVGGILGCGIVLPFLALRAYRGGKALSSVPAAKALTYSTFFGVALSDGIGVAKYMDMDRDGLEDRVYRLYYNASQARCDKYSLSVGAVCAATTALFRSPSMFTIIGGFAAGSAIGTSLHVLTSKEKSRGNGKMVHELAA